jgi:hypothetical protein
MARMISKAIGFALGGLACAVSSFPPPLAQMEPLPTSTGGIITQCPYFPPDLDKVPECNGVPATCVGTAGDDIIWGTEDEDVIVAGAGDDVVHADTGDDIVCMGTGNDSVHGGRGDDQLYGEAGTDWLFGAQGEDSLYGGEGDKDVLWGGPGVDHLDGGPGIGDRCLQQRDEATVNAESCEDIYPPPGYVHEGRTSD